MLFKNDVNMIQKYVLMVLFFCGGIGIINAVPQRIEQKDDSTMNAIKIMNLNARKTSLQKQIELEDKKRNRVIEGVDPENMELINDRQDSLCLALRSQLTDVQLELNELVPKKTVLQVIQHYNVLSGKNNKKND